MPDDRPCAVTHRRPGSLDAAESADLHRALVTVADEFVPSLARRASTTQPDLRPHSAALTASGTVDAYFAQMLTQHTLVATSPSDGLMGFASFRLDHPVAALGDRTATYLSTIAVLPTARRSGVARRLYAALLRHPEVAGTAVVLRTWSTNDAHLTLLRELGFRVVLQVRDDRGEGIDTLYLMRPPDPDGLPRSLQTV